MNSENQYTDANGVRYEAQRSDVVCDGCAFDTDEDLCLALPESAIRCTPLRRADKRSIIWIKAK